MNYCSNEKEYLGQFWCSIVSESSRNKKKRREVNCLEQEDRVKRVEFVKTRFLASLSFASSVPKKVKEETI